MEVAKTHPSLTIWFCQFLPRESVKRPLVDRATPPILFHTRCELFAHFFCQKKATHVVCGIASIIVLSKTSLPAHAKSLSDQPCILLLDRSPMCSKVPLVIRPKAVGRPRYLSLNASIMIPSVPLIFCQMELGVLGLKNIALLSLLARCPEASSKILKMLFNLSVHFEFAFKKIRQLSAKSR